MYNPVEKPKMAEEEEKSMGKIIFETIRNLNPKEARSALREAEDRYFRMLEQRVQERQKELEYSQVQMKEFQS